MNLPPILKSELFWSAIVGIVSMILIALIPGLADNIAQLGPIVLTIIGILLGGFTFTIMQRQSIEGTIRVETIRAEMSVRTAELTAQSVSHSHG